MRPDTELCWKQAKNHLDIARQKLQRTFYNGCAFLSQRAVEQALKAIYIEQTQRRPPMTHNLIQLGESCKVARRLKASLAILNPKYFTVLSPNGQPVESFSEQDATEYLHHAERVVKWCEKRLLNGNGNHVNANGNGNHHEDGQSSPSSLSPAALSSWS